MTQRITVDSSQWIEPTRFDKDLSRSYLSFDSLNTYEEIKSQESVLTQSYAAIIGGLSRSQEGIDSKELIKTFIQKAIQFIGFVINTIIKIIYNVVMFFKKLFTSVMNESLMRSYGQFYESHKETILENFRTYGSSCYVTAIPPKSASSFDSDNKLVLSTQQTVNLLEELDRTFKQRVELWDKLNQRANARDPNNLFEQLRRRADMVKTHITDSILLAQLGIKIQYDIRAIGLHDPQVRDYILNMANNAGNGNSSVIESLAVIFRVPKQILNVYLFGTEEVKSDNMTVPQFLQTTGSKEFDKLSYNDMNRIKANTLIIEGLVKKMDSTSKKLQSSSDKFCDSLQKNSSVLINLCAGGPEEAQSAVQSAKDWIIPILTIANSFYSYFSTIIVNYSMYYYYHRKSLLESAKVLVSRSKIDE